MILLFFHDTHDLNQISSHLLQNNRNHIIMINCWKHTSIILLFPLLSSRIHPPITKKKFKIGTRLSTIHFVTISMSSFLFLFALKRLFYVFTYRNRAFIYGYAPAELFPVESDSLCYREELCSVVVSGTVFPFISFALNNQVFIFSSSC